MNSVDSLLSLAKQLTYIYSEFETWHKTRLTYEQALKYHYDRLVSGVISVVEKNGVVLGYIERYFEGDTCILHNVFIFPDYRNTWVAKELKRIFFATLPENIKHFKGEKQRFGGTWRSYGKY